MMVKVDASTMLVSQRQHFGRLLHLLRQQRSFGANTAHSQAGKMPVFYGPGDYTVPLPSGHRFPMERYAATHRIFRETAGLPEVPTPPAYYLGPRPEDHASGATTGPLSTTPPPGAEHITAPNWRSAVDACSAATSAWRSAVHTRTATAAANVGAAGGQTVPAESVLDEIRVAEPRVATLAECAAGHTESFVRRYADGSLPLTEYRRIGFDWSPTFVQRTLRITGGTLEAAEAALTANRSYAAAEKHWVGQGGIACNGAGGTHHGFPRHGEGFCIVNDASVAARLALYDPAWRARYGIRRVLVLDLDVHQGNGTAACFARGWREACEHSAADPKDTWHGLPQMGSSKAAGSVASSRGSCAALVCHDEYSPSLLRYSDLHSARRSQASDASEVDLASDAPADDMPGNADDGTFDVLTVSVHGAKNYPWSSRYPCVLDVDVPDQTGDDDYISILQQVLATTQQTMEGHSAAQLAVLQRLHEASSWDRGFGQEVLPPTHLCGLPPNDRSALHVPLPSYLQPAATQALAAQAVRSDGSRGLVPSPRAVLGPLLGTPWYIPGRTLLLYQAGVDPLRHDRLGRLGLSRAGLHARNELVFQFAERLGLPTVVSMGGGYSKPIEASARAHVDVFIQAAASWRRRRHGGV